MNSEAEKILAIMFDESKDVEIRTLLNEYNNEAASIESGQLSVFENRYTKAELLKIVVDRHKKRILRFMQ